MENSAVETSEPVPVESPNSPVVPPLVEPTEVVVATAVIEGDEPGRDGEPTAPAEPLPRFPIPDAESTAPAE
jgi:hypothetical protein